MPEPLTNPAARQPAIADASDDAIIGTDLHGTITSWNKAAERIFGYAAVEVLARPIGLLVPADRHAEEDDARARIRRGDAVAEFQTVRRRKDTTLVPISLRMSAVHGPEGIVGVSLVAHDLSRRRRIEPDALRMAAIIESSDDAIVGKDLNGIVMTWNRSAERMFGYSADEMIGQSIRIIIPDALQTEEDDVIARIRRGDRVEHFETVRRRKDGTFIPISLTISPIRNAEGVVIGASKVARDITDRKQAENERARLFTLAQESSRLKDEFLATLSHELRTPLNAILGYTRMIRSGMVTGEKQQRAIDTIERNATSLTEIIEDVLDVSRIISGKIRLNMQPVDLSALVREGLETVRPAAEARGIRIESILDSGDASVSGDPERLQQVLWNLMSNAVKFTDRDGRVQVRLDRAGSHVELIVSDTGIGIAPEFLPHVFERFRQADAGTTREHGGLGLGLAITRHLVEMHGGTIDVASDGPGNGATFRVKLPLMTVHLESDTEDHVHTPAHRSRAAIDVPALDGVSILAVDDDLDALMMVREILETTGAHVTTAESADEAFKIIEHNQPDVLLADVGLPKTSGLQLVAQLRQSANPRIRDVPAAALTAYARSEDRANALRSGFQLHLAKPIDPAELLAAIASLAKRRV